MGSIAAEKDPISLSSRACRDFTGQSLIASFSSSFRRPSTRSFGVSTCSFSTGIAPVPTRYDTISFTREGSVVVMHVEANQATLGFKRAFEQGPFEACPCVSCRAITYGITIFRGLHFSAICSLGSFRAVRNC